MEQGVALKDPFGALLVLIRDDPAVAALVSGRVSALAETPPSVQIIENATTRRPFGLGSGRIGMQLAVYICRCWGTDASTGAIAARQLAGAVSDAIHNHGPATVGTTLILRAYAPELEGLARDPVIKRPFIDVRIDLYAAAEAVA